MDAYLHFILPLSFFIFFLVIILRKWRSAPQKTLPPSPKKLPIIGNLHQIWVFPHQSLRELSRHYGPLMLLHFGCVPVLVVSSPDAAQQILKKQDVIFSNRPKLSIADRLLYGSRDVAFARYGEYWRQVRSLYVLHLLNTKRVQSFRYVREEETTNMVEKILQIASSSGIVNLSVVFVAFTNDVLCRVALGRKYGEDGEGRMFKKVLDEFIHLLGIFNIGDYVPWLSWIDRLDGTDRRVEKVANFLDVFLENLLEKHRQNKESLDDDGYSLDFIDILLEFRRDNKENFRIEDNTIKALILDMFAAGMDSTSAVLDWAMADLLKNPRAMKKLQNEVRTTSKGKEQVTEEDLDKMPYLRAVIKESLRLHPPGPLLIPRESTQDTEVMGYDIASGTRVLINVWALGRDPTLWENPEDFYPERFLDVSTDFRGLHFELIPFGAGRRGCPGVAFGVAVEELALAKLVQRFDFSLADGGEQEDLDMTETVGLVVHRKLPLLVTVTSHYHS